MEDLTQQTKNTEQLVREYIQKGHTLSDIQKLLLNEHQLSITYLDLRLMASTIDATPVDSESTEKLAEAGTTETIIKGGSDNDAEAGDGNTKVTVDTVVRPGSIVSGTVKFASGANGKWYLDQMGRLGLDPDEGSSKPDQQDITDFQAELQKVMAKDGY